MKSIRRIILVFGVMALSFVPFKAESQYGENALTGKTAPDFTLKTLTGDNLSLSKFKEGKKAIVFFWATWCPHCHEAILQLKTRAQELEQKNIQLVLVDLGENERLVRSYTKKNKVAFNIFLDEDSSLAEKYDLIGVPTFFFLNDNGRVEGVLHSLPDNFEEIFSKT